MLQKVFKTFFVRLLETAALLFFSLPANAQNVTPYQQTCTSIVLNPSDGKLTAQCKNYFGNPENTVLLKASDCAHRSIAGLGTGTIWNVDGQLRCIFSEHPSQSGRDIFDVISETDLTDSAGDTKVWLIEHPDVISPMKGYPFIPLKPGDKIKIASAGGCVQTGGMGNTWKLYAAQQSNNPSGLYGGLLLIRGATPTSNGTAEAIWVLMAQQPPDGWTIPSGNGPDQANNLTVQLGYSDDGYSDNGYYSHDNGTDNQCAGVGAAYIRISVFTPKHLDPTGPVWTKFPSGKEFDLVWNINGADNNNLPLNPVWSAQVMKPGSMPDFDSACISGGYLNTGLPSCTSQETTLDQNSGIADKLAQNIGGDCGRGSVHGHLNWSIATYQGRMLWRDWSGNGTQDDDDNLGLETLDYAGQTALSEVDSGVKRVGLGVEFKQSETLDNFAAPFWTSFLAASDASKSTLINGAPAVITALVGVDAVHGGYSELHPAFSMAVRTSETWGKGTVAETWAFFIRNAGNEGGCASNEHEWPSDTGIYSIQVPWPEGAEDAMPTITAAQAWADNNKDYQVLNAEAGQKWTYLRFKLPPQSLTGIDGQLTLQYTVKPKPKKKDIRTEQLVAVPRTGTTPATEDKEALFGIDWEKAAARIANPATRQRFLKDGKSAIVANTAHHLKHGTALTIDRTVRAHQATEGNASHGKPTRAGARIDEESAKQQAALKRVLDHYAADLHLYSAAHSNTRPILQSESH